MHFIKNKKNIVKLICIHQLNSMNLNSVAAQPLFSTAGQLRENLHMSLCYLSTLVLILRIISNSFHQAIFYSSSTPIAHSLSAAGNMHRFSLSLSSTVLLNTATQGQRWQSPHCCSKSDQHGNWLIPVKPICMLSSTSKIWTNQVQSIREDKVLSLFFTLFRDFSLWLLFPVHAAEELPFILEILFLSLLCVVPPFFFLVPCRKRGSIQSILFFYSAMPADTRLHAVDDGDKQRWEFKARRGLRLPGLVFLLSFSPLLALTHAETGAWGET